MKQGGQHGGGGTEAAEENPWEAVDNQVSGLMTGQMQETFTTTERGTRVFGGRGDRKHHYLEKRGTRYGRQECIHTLNTQIKGAWRIKDVLITEGRREALTCFQNSPRFPP